MPDATKPNELIFAPYTTEELKSEIFALLLKLRSEEGEEYIETVRQLWATEEQIQWYLSMGKEARTAQYDLLLKSTPDSTDKQSFQLRCLVLYCLEDAELEKVLHTIPECKAREMGFQDLRKRIALTAHVVNRYLEFCMEHYASSGKASWETLVSADSRYSILQYPAQPDLELEIGVDLDLEERFSDARIDYYKRELMECSFEILEKIVIGLEDAEARLKQLLAQRNEEDEA